MAKKITYRVKSVQVHLEGGSKDLGQSRDEVTITYLPSEAPSCSLCRRKEPYNDMTFQELKDLMLLCELLLAAGEKIKLVVNGLMAEIQG